MTIIAGWVSGAICSNTFFLSAFRLCPFVGCRFIKVNAIKSDGTLNFYKTYGGFREITESADTVEMVVDLNEVDVPDRPFPE